MPSGCWIRIGGLPCLSKTRWVRLGLYEPLRFINGPVAFNFLLKSGEVTEEASVIESILKELTADDCGDGLGLG